MKRFVVLTCGAALAFAALSSAAQAATKTVSMGVPGASAKKFSPPSYDVNDFFPHGVKVHVGDSVRFVPSGFHNVDLPKKGGTPLPLLAAQGPITGSVDAAGAAFWFNGQSNEGFNLAVVFGSLGKKVTYTGAKAIQSGLPISAHPKPMTVKFAKAGKYTYYCDVHAGMKGTVTVVAKSKAVPTTAADKASVAKQVATALKATKGLKAVMPGANTIDVGSAGAHGTEFYGFVPSTLNVPVGTTVKFQMSPKSREDHTVTTGPGNIEDPTSYIGAIANSFAGSPTIDPRGVYPSQQPPTVGALTPTLHGNGFWNSGVLDTVGASPLPSSSSVTFAAAGTYQFYCLIHPFMHGTVVVS